MIVRDVLVLAHVLGGGLGLASMVVPLVAKKGGRAHARAGWVFTAGMTLASVTGLVITAVWMFTPLTFKPLDGATPEALAAHVASVRGGAVFLGGISILTLSALWSAIRALGRKRAPEPSAARVDTLLPAVLILAGLASALYALATAKWLVLVFAVIELGTGAQDLRFARRPLSSRMAWWYQHMRGMMTAVIGAVTAFFVLGARTVIEPLVPPSLAFLPWLAPSLVIVPAFSVWIAYYQRRFGERAPRGAATTSHEVRA
ncbi:hypothetical protein L6R52_01435 [Myxococcota bacterium]|nr:hypothetical protein [Myxococcota bacterium]